MQNSASHTIPQLTVGGSESSPSRRPDRRPVPPRALRAFRGSAALGSWVGTAQALSIPEPAHASEPESPTATTGRKSPPTLTTSERFPVSLAGARGLQLPACSAAAEVNPSGTGAALSPAPHLPLPRTRPGEF